MKRSRGRPPRYGRWLPPPEGRVKFTTRLLPSTVEFFRELGRGYANVGIERAEEVMRGFVDRAAAKRRNRG